MAVIKVSTEDSWIVGRWAFRTILRPTIEALTEDMDKEVIKRALALDGLHLPLIDQMQARRIALTMEKVTRGLRKSLIEADPTTLQPIDLEFIEYLSAIESSLRRHYA